MQGEELGLFNNTLMMLAGCLSAIRLYCSENEQGEVDKAHCILQEVAARHGGTMPDLDMYALGLDVPTCRNLGGYFHHIWHEHGVGGGKGEDAVALADFQRLIGSILTRHKYVNESRPLWELYLHGLTVAEAEERWNDLSTAEQEGLVTEAGNDLGLNDRRRGGLYPSEVGYMLRGKPYPEAIPHLKNHYFPGLVAEVHRRLAGEPRPEGFVSTSPDVADLAKV